MDAMVTFAGFDYVDLRVADLARVRAFYDALMPALGLVDIVEGRDDDELPVVEYYERENGVRTRPSPISRALRLALGTARRSMRSPESWKLPAGATSSTRATHMRTSPTVRLLSKTPTVTASKSSTERLPSFRRVRCTKAAHAATVDRRPSPVLERSPNHTTRGHARRTQSPRPHRVADR